MTPSKPVAGWIAIQHQSTIFGISNMQTNVNLNKVLSIVAVVLGIVLLSIEPAFAQGLEKVNTFIDNVLVVLRGISIAVVTIAIMWAGYKFLFTRADIGECGKILAGGLLIGGAAELASYLLG